MHLSAEEIAKIIDGKIIGKKEVIVNAFAKIEDANKGDICFYSNPKYLNHFYESNASIIIINNKFQPNKNKSKNITLISVDDSYSSFSKLLSIYEKKSFTKNGVCDSTEIAQDVNINKDNYIGPFSIINKKVKLGNNVKILGNCYIGKNVKIGENTIIYSGVNIYDNCIIGKNNTIHSGCVIGSDGFGFALNKKTNQYSKIKQIGNVITHENVEIGANTTIDKATMGSTIINKNVKLDNLIQIGHNVNIGEDTVIASQVAIAGSSKIGKRCMIGGQTAISGHLTIADEVKIAGKSGVASSILEKGKVIQGPMAYDIRKYQRSYVIFKRLPEIYRKILKI
jgi:UDP-3-O-[3-hydroxymyristoyl] glucosamine N-acyltransferase